MKNILTVIFMMCILSAVVSDALAQTTSVKTINVKKQYIRTKTVNTTLEQQQAQEQEEDTTQVKRIRSLRPTPGKSSR